MALKAEEKPCPVSSLILSVEMALRLRHNSSLPTPTNSITSVVPTHPPTPSYFNSNPLASSVRPMDTNSPLLPSYLQNLPDVSSERLQYYYDILPQIESTILFHLGYEIHMITPFSLLPTWVSIYKLSPSFSRQVYQVLCDSARSFLPLLFSPEVICAASIEIVRRLLFVSFPTLPFSFETEGCVPDFSALYSFEHLQTVSWSLPLLPHSRNPEKMSIVLDNITSSEAVNMIMDDPAVSYIPEAQRLADVLECASMLSVVINNSFPVKPKDSSEKSAVTSAESYPFTSADGMTSTVSYSILPYYPTSKEDAVFGELVSLSAADAEAAQKAKDAGKTKSTFPLPSSWYYTKSM